MNFFNFPYQFLQYQYSFLFTEQQDVPLLEPLTLMNEDAGNEQPASSESAGVACPCLLCSATFIIPVHGNPDEFLRHLLLTHKFVIADVKLVSDLRR